MTNRVRSTAPRSRAMAPVPILRLVSVSPSWIEVATPPGIDAVDGGGIDGVTVAAPTVRATDRRSSRPASLAAATAIAA